MARDSVKTAWAVIGCCALLAAGAVPAQATFPGKNGKIAFSDAHSPCFPEIGNGLMHTVNPDGTGLETLGEGCNPAWSSDGTRLAFDLGVPDPSYDEGANFVFTSAADGSDRRDLGFVGFNMVSPDWSPDGQTITFGCDAGVCAMSSTGGSRRVLLADECAGGLSWSPDGTRVAFGRIDLFDECSGPTGIFTMPAQGGPPTLVVEAEYASGPDWSPDGQKLLYSSAPVFRSPALAVGQSDMFSVGATGGGPVNLTETATQSEHGSWSPDGTQIVFTRGPIAGPADEVYRMKADGADATLVVTEASSPDWQPLAGPRRADYKNRAHFCKAESGFWGAATFRVRYGGHANAFGKCVSAAGAGG